MSIRRAEVADLALEAEVRRSLQNPEQSRVVIIGNDANYSEAITNSKFFSKIVEYHGDGIHFWTKYNRH